MKEFRPALLMFIVFTLMLGGLYPAAVTGVAHMLFPDKAKGSFITDDSNREVGSPLIGQPFSDGKYFWPRPSATAEFGYNPMASAGSNSGPTNPAYLETVAGRVKAFRGAGVAGNIPADLVQASASGLDPDISPAAAAVQVARVAKARGLAEAEVARLVAEHAKPRQLGFLGEPRVNVFMLNLALDGRGR